MTQDSSALFEVADFVPGSEDPRLPIVAEPLRAGRGMVPLHEKGTFDQYWDLAQERPRHLVSLEKIANRRMILASAQYYRIVFRSTIHASEHRKSVFSLLPPGVVTGNSYLPERSAGRAPLSAQLALMSVANSWAFDFLVHRFIGLNLNKFILNRLPIPELSSVAERLVVHSALRLCCNHPGFSSAWSSQMQVIWREQDSPTPHWPVLEGDTARWAVRTAIDAIVATAYHLTRDQYAHILASFSHKSFPEAPQLCMAAFVELSTLGEEHFARTHDPYWDIPVNEKLPRPAIDLGVSGDLSGVNDDEPDGEQDGLFDETETDDDAEVDA